MTRKAVEAASKRTQTAPGRLIRVHPFERRGGGGGGGGAAMAGSGLSGDDSDRRVGPLGWARPPACVAAELALSVRFRVDGLGMSG
jgi:hypothetical protein